MCYYLQISIKWNNLLLCVCVCVCVRGDITTANEWMRAKCVYESCILWTECEYGSQFSDRIYFFLPLKVCINALARSLLILMNCLTLIYNAYCWCWSCCCCCHCSQNQIKPKPKKKSIFDGNERAFPLNSNGWRWCELMCTLWEEVATAAAASMHTNMYY